MKILIFSVGRGILFKIFLFYYVIVEKVKSLGNGLFF